MTIVFLRCGYFLVRKLQVDDHPLVPAAFVALTRQ